MKKIQIKILVVNFLTISFLVLSILFGPIKIIPWAVQPEPVELVGIPTIYIFYLTLFIFIISILILISDYRKMRIKFEILAIPNINMDFIRLSGENIQALKLSDLNLFARARKILFECYKFYQKTNDNKKLFDILMSLLDLSKREGKNQESINIINF